MPIIAKKRRLSNILKLIDTPDPLCSLEEYEKFTHQDLQNMDKAELWKERRRTEIALAVLDHDPIIYITAEGYPVSAEEWLQERLRKIIDKFNEMPKGNSIQHQARKEPAGWT
jgi:hypothetical protein